MLKLTWEGTAMHSLIVISVLQLALCLKRKFYRTRSVNRLPGLAILLRFLFFLSAFMCALTCRLGLEKNRRQTNWNIFANKYLILMDKQWASNLKQLVRHI